MRYPLVVAFVAVTACGGGSSDGAPPTTPIVPRTPSPPVATTSVSLRNNLFDPVDIVVAPSATITFNNADGRNHNVSFANQTITSVAEWSTGDRTVAMPAATGTYAYTCTLHAGMNGSVKVQ
ncbi:MAG: plastocyanin/azurin family copper-binding protein [Gemmatimonadaceae bacterium]